jgi:hypothetical protein
MSRLWKGVSWAFIALLVVALARFIHGWGGLLLVITDVLYPWQVDGVYGTDKSAKAEDVGGFDFEFEEANCSILDKFEVRMIFVSHQGQHQRYRLAVYIADDMPTATLVGPQTVRLSLGSVASFYVRDDHWRDLQVTYDYGLPKSHSAKQP